MGHYIPNNIRIENRETVEPIIILPDYEAIPEDKALICEVDNGLFKAYGYMFSKKEFEYFLNITDRATRWFIMDKKIAEKLSNF